ncbi:hypothetical protein [Enterococcus sp. AZ177]|uniref:hypothetical protein n=1 Tax=unclassified Enterococcus TaxID=2608891 RepID=UPI003D2FB917
MKKVVYGFIFIAVFGLTACGNDKKETSSSSKVEQSESRVKNAESSSSAEVEESKQDKEEMLVNLKSETNKKIIKAFLDASLEIEKQDAVDSIENIPSQAEEVNSQDNYVSQLGFQTSASENAKNITINTYKNIEDLNEAEMYYIETYGELLIVKNESILSIMLSYKNDETVDIFNKYKEVFEKIQ